MLNGEYFGIVKDIEDPGAGTNGKKMRRIRVTIPELGMKDTDYTPWAFAVSSSKSDWLPAVGDVVMIRFKNGDPSMPYYLGIVITAEDVSDEFIDHYTTTFRIDKDDNGNTLCWSKNGIEISDYAGNTITLFCDKNDVTKGFVKIVDTNGNSVLTDKDGIKLTDKNGNKIETASRKISLNSNLEVYQ